MKYVGCKKAKETSLTRDPAHPMATVLIRKSAGDPTPENDDMDFKQLQRVASMSEVTKSYFGALNGEEAVKAFLAKSNEDQDLEAAEAQKAKEDADAKAKAEEEAAKAREAGVSEEMLSLRRENEALKARVDASEQEREIEKTVGDSRFKGYPGGAEKLRETVKMALKVGGEAQKIMLDQAADIAKAALQTGKEFGVRSEAEIAREAPVAHEVYKEADKRAKENGTNRATEIAKMSDEPAWTDKISEASYELEN